jgi:hypothetical protein
VNPFEARQNSALSIAQPITFKTMDRARELAQADGEVEIFYTKYDDESVSVPDSFKPARCLDISIMDIISGAQRRLPLLKDILDRLYEVSDAEYFIYTNIDIALMPHFYQAVNALIDQGYDAFVINRRTISEKFLTNSDLSLMFSELGASHPGHDCFIFKREAYSSYILYNSCIGEPPIGKILLCNLMYAAQKFEEFKNFHLTFHIGKDAAWNYGQHKMLWLHNYKELEKIYYYFQKKDRPLPHSLARHMLAQQRNFFIKQQPLIKRLTNRLSSKFFSKLLFEK